MSDPICPRCGLGMPILFHVNRYCPTGCDKLPPGPPCPQCKSTATGPFETMHLRDDLIFVSVQKIHCFPCGAVWDDNNVIVGED